MIFLIVNLYSINWYKLYFKIVGAGATRKRLISPFFGVFWRKDGDLCPTRTIHINAS
jgi:hypothetical protein